MSAVFGERSATDAVAQQHQSLAGHISAPSSIGTGAAGIVVRSAAEG